MKKSFLLFLLVSLLLPAAWAQNLENAGMDYTKALEKSPGAERAKAFEAYIKTYPDAAANVFTKLAYQWLAVDYYILKNYDKAIQHGEKALQLGGLEKRLEARVNLILADSYGSKDSPKYNKDKALRFADKAIALSREGKFQDVLQNAENVKKSLTAPPPPTVTPEARMAVLYRERKFKEAISHYRSLADKDKQNPVIGELYANSLLQDNQVDAALEAFKALYAKERKGQTAVSLAEVYLKKGARDKQFLDQAIDYFIEASFLYRAENNKANADTALNTAKYRLFEKYDFNRRQKIYEDKLKRNQAQQPSNEQEVIRLERELLTLQRRLNREYYDMDLEPPAFEQDKVENLKKRINQAKSGAKAPEEDKEGAALAAERDKIEKEFRDLVEAVRKRMSS